MIGWLIALFSRKAPVAPGGPVCGALSGAARVSGALSGAARVSGTLSGAPTVSGALSGYDC